MRLKQLFICLGTVALFLAAIASCGKLMLLVIAAVGEIPGKVRTERVMALHVPCLIGSKAG